MRFPLDGGVELYFSHSPDDRPRSVSNVSCDKAPCPITAWDSYEHVSQTYHHPEDQGEYNQFHQQSFFIFFLQS